MINDCFEVLNHLLQLSVNVLCQLVTEHLKKRFKINSKLMVKSESVKNRTVLFEELSFQTSHSIPDC